MIDKCPSLLWEGIAFDAALDDVNGLRGPDETTEEWLLHDDIAELLESFWTLGCSLNGLPQVIGDILGVLSEALEG